MSTCIKAGSYCHVCKGIPSADCWHRASDFQQGTNYADGVISELDQLRAENERLKAVIAKYADKENWNMDSCGVYRVWLEPDSDTPAAYNGWELALAAIKEEGL